MTTSKENSGSFFIKLFCILTLLGAFFVKFDEIKDRFYIFDQNVLQGIAQKNIQLYSNDTHALVRSVVQDLEKEYPGHINVKEEWVFNTAGGAMGQMWIVHASITEYILIFGTDIGTEGHTGRYLCDDYFIILEGEQWSQRPGDLHRMEFKPGDMHLLSRGNSEHYKIPETGWALEYARGWIPLMLPFGLFDTLFSTVDFVTLFHTIRLYATSTVGELLLGKI